MSSFSFVRKIAAATAVLSAALLGACESDLSSDLEGKKCDADGGCLTGYVCDEDTNTCIRQGVSSGCEEGETVCGGECVDLQNDEQHCGGCGATCTAPENGDPACVLGECRLTCSRSY